MVLSILSHSSPQALGVCWRRRNMWAKSLPLQVLAAVPPGTYIGTFDGRTAPSPRVRRSIFRATEAARHALGTGAWDAAQYPVIPIHLGASGGTSP